MKLAFLFSWISETIRSRFYWIWRRLSSSSRSPFFLSQHLSFWSSTGFSGLSSATRFQWFRWTKYSGFFRTFDKYSKIAFELFELFIVTQFRSDGWKFRLVELNDDILQWDQVDKIHNRFGMLNSLIRADCGALSSFLTCMAGERKFVKSRAPLTEQDQNKQFMFAWYPFSRDAFISDDHRS